MEAFTFFRKSRFKKRCGCLKWRNSKHPLSGWEVIAQGGRFQGSGISCFVARGSCPGGGQEGLTKPTAQTLEHCRSSGPGETWTALTLLQIISVFACDSSQALTQQEEVVWDWCCTVVGKAAADKPASQMVSSVPADPLSIQPPANV